MRLLPLFPASQVDRQWPAAIVRRLREAHLIGHPKAPVAELVDALDSKSSSARSAGSIPARGTSRAFALDRHRLKRGVRRQTICTGIKFNRRATLLFHFPTSKLQLFDEPLCLSECGRGPFPKDIDKLN